MNESDKLQLEKDIAQAQQKLSDIMTAINAENLEKERIVVEVKGLTQSIFFLKSELDTLDSSHTQAQAQYKEDITKLTESKNILVKEIANVDNAIRNKEDEIAHLEQNIVDLQASRATLVQDIALEKARLDKDFSEYSDAMAKNKDAIDSELKKLYQEKGEITSSIEYSKVLLANIDKEIESSKFTLGEITKEVNDSKYKLNTLNDAIESRQNDIALLNQELKLKKEEFTIETEKVDALREEIKALELTKDAMVRQAMTNANKETELNQKEIYIKARYEQAGIRYE